MSSLGSPCSICQLLWNTCIELTLHMRCIKAWGPILGPGNLTRVHKNRDYSTDHSSAYAFLVHQARTSCSWEIWWLKSSSLEVNGSCAINCNWARISPAMRQQCQCQLTRATKSLAAKKHTFHDSDVCSPVSKLFCHPYILDRPWMLIQSQGSRSRDLSIQWAEHTFVCTSHFLLFLVKR